MKYVLLVYLGLISGDWRLLRYQIAARVWLHGLRLMRWSWRFSPHFEHETDRMTQYYGVTGRTDGFVMQPPGVMDE